MDAERRKIIADALANAPTGELTDDTILPLARRLNVAVNTAWDLVRKYRRDQAMIAARAELKQREAR